MASLWRPRPNRCPTINEDINRTLNDVFIGSSRIYCGGDGGKNQTIITLYINFFLWRFEFLAVSRMLGIFSCVCEHCAFPFFFVFIWKCRVYRSYFVAFTFDVSSESKRACRACRAVLCRDVTGQVEFGLYGGWGTVEHSDSLTHLLRLSVTINSFLSYLIFRPCTSSSSSSQAVLTRPK